MATLVKERMQAAACGHGSALRPMLLFPEVINLCEANQFENGFVTCMLLWIRTTAVTNGLLIAQGTTTNGDFLLPFKTGAFLAGVPVRPVILKYDTVRVLAFTASVAVIRLSVSWSHAVMRGWVIWA